ncbi:hypothetical protein DIPPA_63739 [Diplonema papillatum]|nr:hypothetical protein DIPPA_63739 [Diplonema papillatum]
MDMAMRLQVARSVWGSGTVAFLQVAPPLSAFVMILSPLATMARIHQSRSTGNYPLMPYALMLANSSVQVLYAILLRDPSILTTHFVGFVSALFYCMIWIAYRSPGAPVGTPLGVATAVTVVGIFFFSSLPPEIATPVIGLYGAILIVSVFVGPLYSLKLVLASKDSSSIPLPFAVAGTVCSVLWLSYGLLVLQEPAVWLPNVVGLVPNFMQLFLLWYYPSVTKKMVPETEATTEVVVNEVDAESNTRRIL